VAELTDAELARLCDAFVEANRAELLDTDFDLPIQRAVERIVIERMRQAWHEGYGAGSSDATDGWLSPGSPRTPNPYTQQADGGSS
jgi:hypothetical protein